MFKIVLYVFTLNICSCQTKITANITSSVQRRHSCVTHPGDMIKNKVGSENSTMQAPKLCFQEFIKQQQQDQEQDKDEGVKDLSMSKSAIMENILKQANLLKQVPKR